ncbi:MAG: hypothetical protein H7Y06_06045 [Opitutaceae bacterium]|nr:hypothetical protein [Opitutaceae bacterium]
MDTSLLRSSKPSDGGSWVWQHRNALETLTEVAAEYGKAASARSVYVALTQLSRMGSPVIEIKRAQLRSIAGVGYSTLDAVNKIMEQAGVVTIDRMKVNGFDFGLRYHLLSVPDKREPVLDKHAPVIATRKAVPTLSTDKSEEVVLKETSEKTASSPCSDAGCSSSAKPNGRAQMRPYPQNAEEVAEAAKLYGYSSESGHAFWAVQQQDGWKIRGRAIMDWHLALQRWCDKDAVRKTVGDPITHEEFLEFVRSEDLDEGIAEDFWNALKAKGGRLLNKRNGRREPVMDIRSAFRSYAASDLNLRLEQLGLR